MSMTTGDKKYKRVPKRLGVEELRERVKQRMSNPKYRGVHVSNVDWNSLEYDESLKRQMIYIKTVDEHGNLDGNTRRVATSDLQHVRYTKELSDSIKRKRNNTKRIEKRKENKS